MDWLLLSLIAAALWGVVSVIDKIVIEKHIPDPIIYSFFLAVYGLVSALVVGSAEPIHLVPIGHTLLALLSGTLYLVYIWLYFMALSRSDATVVVALGQITPIFAIAWGYLFLAEVFEVTKYAGVISTVLGAALASLERHQTATGTRLRFNSALPLMVSACFVRSLSDLLLKFSLQEISTLDGFFWPRLGIFVAALTILTGCSIRRRLWVTVRQLSWRINLLIAGSEATALTGVLAITLAYEYGPLALVAASSAAQPLFVLLLLQLMNRIRPGIILDKTDRCLLTRRSVSLLMIIVGVYWLGAG
jgi:drug/metabolite transporter (DMT)-like permease